MESSKYHNVIISGVSRKVKNDKEIAKKISDKVVTWLVPLYDDSCIGKLIRQPETISDGNEEILENELIFKLFTDDNEYTFLVTIDFEKENHFMEASVKARKPSAGENTVHPKVFPNGDFSDELWEQLKNCILKHELISNVSGEWKQ